MRALAGVASVLLWIATSSSLLRTLVVPRGSSGIVMLKDRALLAGFRAVARRAPTYRGRDRILTWFSAVCIVSSLIMWLAMYFVSYGLMLFATSQLSIRTSFREAGSSLFTLGFASHDRNALTALDFAAAATGPIVIGLLIGYLPTMYAAYQQRESEVTLMLARAGEPNWGPELLGRHAIVGNTAKLDDLWPTWESWAAQIAESHTNFPVLIHTRSARPNRSWLLALLAAMDAAAIQMSLRPDLPQGNMRLLLRQGIICLRELAEVEGLPYDPDPSPDTPSQISLEEFVSTCEALRAARYEMERSPVEAYPHFRGWRANYESVVYDLAAAIDAVPGPWSGPRKPPLPVIMPGRPVNRQPTPLEPPAATDT
jgi:hypothetical protein